MKTLVVMRHGKAAPPVQGQQDMDRSLTKAGVAALDARLPHMLGLLDAADATVRIWTSSARRARQTAEHLAKALKKIDVSVQKKIETHDSLLKQDVDGFLAELRASDAEVVFAVGHVPFVEDVVETLTGSRLSFTPGALGCLEVRPAEDGARLLWFVQGPVSAQWDTLFQLQEAVIKVAEEIEDRLKAFFENPEDIETIHRFRTRTRALRSLIAFMKPWQDARQNAETHKILRDVVRHTSRLRELDVLEAQVRSNPDSSPELLRLCKKEADAERAIVRKILASKEVAKAFKKAMSDAKSIRWRRRYVEHGLPSVEVRQRFDSLVESVKADLDALRLSDAERTHDVRKRAKRARYVSEFNERVLGADAADIAKGMMVHQDTLGDVCDARVNIQLINDLLRQDPPEHVCWELNLMRAQCEAFLYRALSSGGAESA